MIDQPRHIDELDLEAEREGAALSRLPRSARTQREVFKPALNAPADDDSPVTTQRQKD